MFSRTSHRVGPMHRICVSRKRPKAQIRGNHWTPTFSQVGGSVASDYPQKGFDPTPVKPISTLHFNFIMESYRGNAVVLGGSARAERISIKEKGVQLQTLMDRPLAAVFSVDSRQGVWTDWLSDVFGTRCTMILGGRETVARSGMASVDFDSRSPSVVPWVIVGLA